MIVFRGLCKSSLLDNLLTFQRGVFNRRRYFQVERSNRIAYTFERNTSRYKDNLSSRSSQSEEIFSEEIKFLIVNFYDAILAYQLPPSPRRT